MVFVVGLVQAVEFVVVVGCEEFVAAVFDISDHLIVLLLHLGLRLTVLEHDP